jgi:hypothetical protein
MPVDRRYTLVLLISFAMLVVAPVAYLLIAVMLNPDEFADNGFNEFVLYILLVLGIVQPGIVPLLQRMQGPPAERQGAAESAAGLYLTRAIVRMAMIEAVYIYGLVVFLLSGQLTYMWYFYPVGVFWTVILWPRRSNYEHFIQERENR